MREPYEDRLPPLDDQRGDWGVAAAIAVAIAISLVAFVWIFVELEPFMGDFTGRDVIVTPEATELANPNGGATDSATPDASQ
jgi:hypothetical protein